jgi:hypothetical protein
MGGHMPLSHENVLSIPIMRVLKSASDQSNQMAVPQETCYANPIFPRPSTAPASNPNESSEQSEQRRR